MNVSLTSKLESLIQEKVRSGRYSSASEVVREALRLLEERDRLNAEKLKALRRDIAVGLRQANRGETTEGGDVFGRLRGQVKKQRRA